MEEEWTLRESNLLLKVGGVRRRAAAVAPLLALIAFLSGCVVSACGSVPALVIGVRLEPDRASLQVGASARVQVSLIIQGWDGQAPAPYIGGGDGFRTVEFYAVPPNALLLLLALGGGACVPVCGGRDVIAVRLSADPGGTTGNQVALSIAVVTGTSGFLGEELPAGAGEQVQLVVFPTDRAQAPAGPITTDESGQAAAFLRLLAPGEVTVWAGVREAWSEPVTVSIAEPPR